MQLVQEKRRLLQRALDRRMQQEEEGQKGSQTQLGKRKGNHHHLSDYHRQLLLVIPWPMLHRCGIPGHIKLQRSHARHQRLANLGGEQDPNTISADCDVVIDQYNACLTTDAGLPNQWIFDTRETDHRTGSAFEAITLQQRTGNDERDKIKIMGSSTAHIQGAIMSISLLKVQHVPELKNTNLISWRQLAENGFGMKREGKRGDIIHNGIIQGKVALHRTNASYILEQAPNSLLLLSKSTLWHQRLGHLQSDISHKIIRMVQDPACLPDWYEGCN